MGSRALVVDDNFYNRDLARLALESAGYTVEEAENGVEALQILERETYDVLILDLAMPELDGIGVISGIRQTNRHKQMKIVVVTAHAHMTGPIDMDADFVMFKPIDINNFMTFLNRLKPAQTPPPVPTPVQTQAPVQVQSPPPAPTPVQTQAPPLTQQPSPGLTTLPSPEE